MKRIFAFILAAAMLLSMAACSEGNADSNTGVDTTAPTASQLMVGYGKADVTPRDSVPLQGFGATENRMSTGFISFMYIIALAITDPAGETAIVMASDSCTVGNADALNIRNAVAKECDISPDKVIISALHQHSAPDMNNSRASSGIKYKEQVFIPGAVEAAKAAMENRSFITAVQTNTVKTEGLNFLRHYRMKDGSYAGDNFGDFNIGIEDYASEADHSLQLVKFIREGNTTQNGEAAKNIILANFQGHPHLGAGAYYYQAHSDTVGVFRDELDNTLNCQTIYFSGAGGNVNMTSKIEGDQAAKEYKDHGKKLAKYAIEAEDSYTDIELTAVKGTKVAFQAERYTISDADLAVKAEEAWKLYVETGSEELVKKYGFASKYEANAIVNAFKRQNGFGSFDIFALSFGDLAIIAAPYEMFCANGMNIKEQSPFKMTIVSTIANGSNGYFPTEFAWDYGCYEQYSSNYVRGTAEKLEAEYINMLNGLYEQY